MVDGVKPHVGGPILPAGCPTVLIGGQPAARVGDLATCAGPPDVIALGSPTVLIGSMMAARIGDLTAHGGVIVQGFPTVMIDIPGAGCPISPSIGGAVVAAIAEVMAGGAGGAGGVAAGAAGAAGGPSSASLGGVGSPAGTAQVVALKEAAEEGAPLVEECRYHK
jgi:uncharacterized Zn-binding protein involved in type VI secretion